MYLMELELRLLATVNNNKQQQQQQLILQLDKIGKIFERSVVNSLEVVGVEQPMRSYNIIMSHTESHRVNCSSHTGKSVKGCS